MRLAQGRNLAILGVFSLLAVGASAPEPDHRTATRVGSVRTASTDPVPLTGQTATGRTRTEQAALAESPNQTRTMATGQTRGTRFTQPAPSAAATTGALRAKPRFDMDGDGRDELVVAGVERMGSFVLRVRYSGLSRWETLRAPTTPESGRRLTFPYTAGDFNGDGYQDLAVASLRTISPGVFEHGVFIYSGSPSGLNITNVAYLPNLHAGAFAAGDLNGDGHDELAVADSSVTDGFDAFRGTVWVLPGTTTGLNADASVRITQVIPRTGVAEEYFGTSVVIGDHTGDGYGDLVVAGLRRATNENDFHGMLTLFPGSADGPGSTTVTKLEGQSDILGTLPVDVMAMSDMNRDGFEDLILGLPRHGKGGEVLYLPGKAAGLSATGHRLINQDTAGIPGAPDDDPEGSHFGYSLATGDATGDGIPDLLVGAITENVGAVSSAGSVTLIPGTPQGPTGAGSTVYTQDATRSDPTRRHAEPAEVNDCLGSSVALLDLDGAGPLEIFAEAKYEDIGQSSTGEYGLLVTLQLRQSPPRRDSGQPMPAALVPLRLQRPADLSDTTFTFARLGYGLLAG